MDADNIAALFVVGTASFVGWLAALFPPLVQQFNFLGLPLTDFIVVWWSAVSLLGAVAVFLLVDVERLWVLWSIIIVAGLVINGAILWALPTGLAVDIIPFGLLHPWGILIGLGYVSTMILTYYDSDYFPQSSAIYGVAGIGLIVLTGATVFDIVSGRLVMGLVYGSAIPPVLDVILQIINEEVDTR